MYCKKCGAMVNDEAVVCVSCGCSVDRKDSSCCSPSSDFNSSPYSGVTVMLLCFFLGCIGVHRFYVGKTGTGLIMLFTAGGCGIWTLIDFIMILMGDFRDSAGKRVSLQNR